MKLLFILLAIFFSVDEPEKKIFLLADVACKEVLDSADVLNLHSPVSITPGQRVIDEKRELAVSKWIEARSYFELNCLLNSGNKMHQYLGFLYMGMRFMDSLTKYYSHMLQDTTDVQFYNPDGLGTPRMKMGFILKSIYTNMVEDQKQWNKQPLVQEKVQSFIRQYARHPETYQSISFPEFSISSYEGAVQHFSIIHQYKLRNVSGKLVTENSAFVMDTTFHISVIAKDSTHHLSAFPPMIGNWLAEFGRTLNKKDSISLKLK